MTRWPSTWLVAPQRSTSALSMQSQPANIDWTRVSSLRPGCAAPGRSPRSISASAALLDAHPLGQQQARVGDRVGVVEADVQLVQGVGGKMPSRKWPSGRGYGGRSRRHCPRSEGLSYDPDGIIRLRVGGSRLSPPCWSLVSCNRRRKPSRESSTGLVRVRRGRSGRR
jgi:hypothetical protein